MFTMSTLAKFVGSCLFPLVTVVSTTETFSAECTAQHHFDNQPPGQLVITEYAFSYRKSDCPTDRIAADAPIGIGRGTTLYIWLRLQGDLIYLSKSQSGRSLRASFYLDTGGRLVYQKALPLGEIDRAKTVAEANSFGGIFDWRVRAEKWAFQIPGDYVLWIEQANQMVCPMKDAGRDCSISFRVVAR